MSLSRSAPAACPDFISRMLWADSKLKKIEKCEKNEHFLALPIDSQTIRDYLSFN
jgi:hypothetical protein